MPKINNKTRKQVKIIILVIVGIIALIGSLAINILGVKQIINKEPDTSGMVGFSVRTNGTTSLGNKKEKKVDDEGKIVEEDILVNCVPIINLNNNGWDRLKSKFSGFELDSEGNAIFSDGYTLYCNGKYVNYVIFDSNYKGEVIGHLKVGEDFKKIEETLGIPTFKSKDYLGYKTKEVYVFFYENEISVYPNRNISNSEIENLFKDYFDKTYDKERTYFLVNIRNNYEDFTIELNEDSNEVIIKSTTRQVIAKLDGIGNIEVELYNGYKVANESTQDYIDSKKYILNEQDLVEITENERVSGK